VTSLPITPGSSAGPRPVTAARQQRALRFGLIADVFRGLQWDLGYVGFLYYCCAIFTYRLPRADVGMVLGALGLVLQLRQLRWHPFLTAMSVFLGWSALTALASNFSAVSWQECWTLVKVGIVAVVAFNVLNSRARVRFAMVLFSFVFLLYPLRGALLNWAGGYSYSGRAIWNYAYGNPNDLAGFAILFLSFMLSARELLTNRLARLGAVLACVATVALIFLTQSRGAIVACGATLVLTILSQRGRLKTLLVSAAVVGVAALFAPQSVWDRLGGLKNASLAGSMKGVDSEGSAEQRWQIAQVAFRMAQENALLGVGIGAYSSSHAVYASRMINDLRYAGGERDAHNTYLRIAAEMGLPGLLLFFTMLAAVVVPAVRLNINRAYSPPEKPIRKFLLLGLLAFLLAGFFASLGYLNILYIQLALIAALSSNAEARGKPTAGRRLAGTGRYARHNFGEFRVTGRGARS
jgi:O-antigen ligase